MKTYEVHYSFLLDGAKVKMFHKTILSSVTQVAHPLVTPSLQTPSMAQSFQYLALLFFVHSDRPLDLRKMQPQLIFYYSLVTTNQIKAGTFFRMTALSTKVSSSESRILTICLSYLQELTNP